MLPMQELAVCGLGGECRCGSDFIQPAADMASGLLTNLTGCSESLWQSERGWKMTLDRDNFGSSSFLFVYGHPRISGFTFPKDESYSLSQQWLSVHH